LQRKVYISVCNSPHPVCIRQHLSTSSTSSLIHVGVRAPQVCGSTPCGEPRLSMYIHKVQFKIIGLTFLTYSIFLIPMRFWEFNKENEGSDFLPALKGEGPPHRFGFISLI